MSDDFLAGAAQVDITPPVGTALAGSTVPRKSLGVQDPLTIKAVVLESGSVRLAYALYDLISVRREEGGIDREWLRDLPEKFAARR